MSIIIKWVTYSIGDFILNLSPKYFFKTSEFSACKDFNLKMLYSKFCICSGIQLRRWCHFWASLLSRIGFHEEGLWRKEVYWWVSIICALVISIIVFLLRVLNPFRLIFSICTLERVTVNFLILYIFFRVVQTVNGW